MTIYMRDVSISVGVDLALCRQWLLQHGVAGPSSASSHLRSPQKEPFFRECKVSQRQSKESPLVVSVALKDVFCRGEAALQQSLFEVQLLMAVERRMSRGLAPPARLPRCLTYQASQV